MALTVSPKSIAAGKRATASIAVKVDRDGDVTAGKGVVDVFVDGVRHRTVSLDRNGRATAPLGPFATSGARVVTATYRGAKDVGSSSSSPVVLRVTKASSKVGVRITPRKVTTGTRARVTVTVKAPGLALAGIVKVREGKRVVGTATVRSGAATLKLRAFRAAGAKRLTLAYSGGGAVANRTAKLKLTVR